MLFVVTRPRFYQTLYFRVICGIAAGVALGSFYPSTGEAMKPVGDGFIKLIRMMIAPVIFLTVVTGIARIGDMRKLGRVGIKALAYFEVVTTIALLVGFVVVKVVQPGAGINATAATLDAAAVQQYTTSGKELHAVDFVLHMIPDTLAGAFATSAAHVVTFESPLQHRDASNTVYVAIKADLPVPEAVNESAPSTN